MRLVDLLALYKAPSNYGRNSNPGNEEVKKENQEDVVIEREWKILHLLYRRNITAIVEILKNDDFTKPELRCSTVKSFASEYTVVGAILEVGRPSSDCAYIVPGRVPVQYESRSQVGTRL